MWKIEVKRKGKRKEVARVTSWDLVIPTIQAMTNGKLASVGVVWEGKK